MEHNEFGCAVCKYTIGRARLPDVVMERQPKECANKIPPVIQCTCLECGSVWRHWVKKWDKNTWEACIEGEPSFYMSFQELASEVKSPLNPIEIVKLKVEVFSLK